MSFADLFQDFMPDVVIVQPGHVTAYGDFIASGSTLSIPCRIEGANRLVRNSQGKEVVSSVQVITGEYNNLTVNNHRYTLPVRFSPNSNLQAISVVKESDEIGPCYEEVYLP